jgi:hypothetical protein
MPRAALILVLSFGLVGHALAAPPAKPVPKVKATKRAPHPAVAVAYGLIDAIRAGTYDHEVYQLSSDDEFPPAKRAALFRDLARYIAGSVWTVDVVALGFARGREDDVELWLHSDDGGWLALYVGYHYDAKRWRVDGYEYPKMTFKKPGASVEEYVVTRLLELRHLPPVRDHRAGEDGTFRLDP